MSLILDALNRSRGEADREAVPSLDSVHFTGESSKPWLPWVLAAGAVVAVLLVVWVVWALWKTAPQPESPPASGPAVVSKSDAQLAAEAARASAQSTPAQPPQAQQRPAPQAVTLGGRVNANARPVTPRSVETNEPADTAVERQPSAAVTALYDRAPVDEPTTDIATPAAEARDLAEPSIDAAESSASEDIPIDVAEVLRRAQQDLGQARLSDHPVPALDTLSQQTKDRIPTVVYSAHDYQAGGQSSVTLNGTRLTTGQRAEGFQVKEILVDSVVLSWGGTDFRLRALNSWINL